MKINASLLLASLALVAGAADKPNPSFQNVRYDDDAVARQAALYYTPLPYDEGSDLSIGGQARMRGEAWGNFAFVGDNDDDFLLTRLRLHADLHAYRGFRVFVEGISALASDRDLPGGRRAIDTDSADLLNAFADISTDVHNINFTLRGGRQEMQYGKQRLVSPLDWANTRRTFDGVKLIAQTGGGRIDAFLTRLVHVQKYEFNDGDSGRDFYGVYATRKIPARRAVLDAYWLGLERDSATAADEQRDTFGARLGGVCGESGFDYDFEGAYQAGDAGDADVKAGFIASQVGYSFPDCPANPRLYFGYDYASGDDDPDDDDVGTFNQLFPLGHAYFGALDFVGRQNISDVSAGLTFAAAPKLKVKIEGHHFERADTRDALYDAGGNVLRAGDAGTDSEIGQEADLILDYQWNIHTLLQAGYGHFFAGDFIAQSGDDQDADLVYLTAQHTL